MKASRSIISGIALVTAITGILATVACSSSSSGGGAMPLAVTTREIIQTLIGNGYEDTDFATLLELQAKASNLELVAEDVDVGTGLQD